MTRLLTAVAAILATVATAAAYPCYTGTGRPYRPYSTRVLYEAAGVNTMVLMRLNCGGGSEDWYVGFFYGHDQPTLREWADIQNTASMMLP